MGATARSPLFEISTSFFPSVSRKSRLDRGRGGQRPVRTFCFSVSLIWTFERKVWVIRQNKNRFHLNSSDMKPWELGNGTWKLGTWKWYVKDGVGIDEASVTGQGDWRMEDQELKEDGCERWRDEGPRAVGVCRAPAASRFVLVAPNQKID